MAPSAGPGSHLCGHPNKHKRPGERRRGTCRHLVSDDSGYRYCEDHRDGCREFVVGRAYRSPAPADRTTSQPPGVARMPARDSAPRAPGSGGARRRGQGWKDDGVPDDAVYVAVEQARTIATDDWTRLAQRRVARALGTEIAQEARSRGASILCNELAEVAEALLAAKRWAIRAVEDTAVPLFGWFGKPRLARLVARQFAKHLVSVPAAKITATAHALRAYGVLVCVLDGRELARCRCLRSLVETDSRERIRAEVREVVGHGLEPLGRL